jgi:hypothetical protein
MTVPLGGTGVLGVIKDVLTQSGWELVVDRGPDVTTGSLGEQTKLASGQTYRTRYRLAISQTGGPHCYNYDLSIVDNRSGKEFLTDHGAWCVFRKDVGPPNLMAALKAP